LQEHAFAKPDAAWARCPLSAVNTAVGATPLFTTELKMSSATAAMLAARAWTGASVVVAVRVTVSVVIKRVVEVMVVVIESLVVIVL
jgi:hypothetical protein